MSSKACALAETNNIVFIPHFESDHALSLLHRYFVWQERKLQRTFDQNLAKKFECDAQTAVKAEALHIPALAAAA